jgi:hypothetical protein
MTESKRQQYEKKLTALKNERSNWEGDWKIIQENFMPFRGRFFMSEANKPQKTRINATINNRGIMAVRTMRSGLMAGVTSPARPWFRLATTDPDMMKFRPVKEYMETVERMMRDIFAQSNLYQVLPNVYGELGTFGTACMIAMPNFNDVIRFFPITVGQYSLATNEDQNVDTMYREFRMTAKQAVERFNGRVSQTILNAYNAGNLNTMFDFCHAIEPNGKAKSNAIFGTDLPYASVYFEKGGNNEFADLSRESGFGAFNVMAPRWETTGEDVYGYGCGYYGLGDNKQLQIQEKRKGQAIDTMVRPPLKAPATMKNTPIVGVPAGVTYYDSTSPSGGDGISPLYEIRPAIQELSMDMARVEERISRAFYEDLFLMLAQSDRREITAREIDERVEEKLLMLGPAMESMHNELLNPLIANTYAEMVKADMLPEPPEEIAGKPLKVEYISTMAQAQKMVGIGAIERWIGFVGNVAAIYPDARHKVDAVSAVDSVGEMLGVPQKLIRPDEDVKQIMSQEAAQAQAQQAMQTGMAGVQAAEMLSNAQTSKGNLLQTIAGV